MRKTVLIIIDGLGDLPVPGLGMKTPLQYAHLPTLDMLCKRGWTGIMDPVEAGLACGSDTAHLSIFGYPPVEVYRGRGAFETMGNGVDMNPGEIAFKCVFSCWDEKTGMVTKRKPERDFVNEARQFCQHLINVNLLPSFPNHRVEIHYAKEHRCVIKVVGPSLSDAISGTDPTKDPMPLLECVPTDDSAEARFTCEIITELHKNIYRELKNHPVNTARNVLGNSPVNVCLLRGCSMAIDVPSFQERHGLRALLVAPTPIIAGIGKTLKMTLLKAPGATGSIDTDMTSKAQVAMDALFKDDEFDMAVIHIKCVDDCGHDGDADGKIFSLQKVEEMVKWILERPEMQAEDHLIAITGDHSTPIVVSDHSSEPVPFVVSHGRSVKSYNQPDATFDEISCSRGMLGRFSGSSVMSILKNLKGLL